METFITKFADTHFKVGDILKHGGANNHYVVVLDNGKREETGNVLYNMGILRVSRWWLIRKIQLMVLKSVL